MEHSANVMLYTIGYLNELKAKGLVKGDREITARGIAAFDQLVASGFKPSAEEFGSCIEFLKRDGADHG